MCMVNKHNTVNNVVKSCFEVSLLVRKLMLESLTLLPCKVCVGRLCR